MAVRSHIDATAREYDRSVRRDASPKRKNPVKIRAGQKGGQVCAERRRLILAQGPTEILTALKGVLEGRVVFTPRADETAVDFVGRVRMGPFLAGSLVTTERAQRTPTEEFYEGHRGRLDDRAPQCRTPGLGAHLRHHSPPSGLGVSDPVGIPAAPRYGALRHPRAVSHVVDEYTSLTPPGPDVHHRRRMGPGRLRPPAPLGKRRRFMSPTLLLAHGGVLPDALSAVSLLALTGIFHGSVAWAVQARGRAEGAATAYSRTAVSTWRASTTSTFSCCPPRWTDSSRR